MFVACLPILLLGVSIGWAVNSWWLYEHAFRSYGISQSLAKAGLELTDAELEKIYSGLITYFNSGDEYVSLTVVKDGKTTALFTREEAIHFRDVKGLIWRDYWLVVGTLLYCLAYAGGCLFRRDRRYRLRLARAAVVGSGVTLTLILALGLGAVFGFGQLFFQFHRLFFANEYWSAPGYMLLLFPERFFYDATLFCALATAGMAIVLGGAGGGYLLATRKRLPSKKIAETP